MDPNPLQQHSKAILIAGLVLGILVLAACSLLSVGAPRPPATPAASGRLAPVPPQTPNPRATPRPRAGRISINYTAADVDRAEARWKSKQVNTYQIEVWSGGITPPPPVYVVQVWRGQVVFAAADRRWGGGEPRYETLDPASAKARAVTVPGLFVTARELLADAQGPADNDVEIQAEFDEEWGFPKNMGQSAKCPDCIWYSQVKGFVVFDQAEPPPTPTPVPVASPP